jgi:hypothetical protein
MGKRGLVATGVVALGLVVVGLGLSVRSDAAAEVIDDTVALTCAPADDATKALLQGQFPPDGSFPTEADVHLAVPDQVGAGEAVSTSSGLVVRFSDETVQTLQGFNVQSVEVTDGEWVLAGSDSLAGTTSVAWPHLQTPVGPGMALTTGELGDSGGLVASAAPASATGVVSVVDATVTLALQPLPVSLNLRCTPDTPISATVAVSPAAVSGGSSDPATTPAPVESEPRFNG